MGALLVGAILRSNFSKLLSVRSRRRRLRDGFAKGCCSDSKFWNSLVLSILGGSALTSGSGFAANDGIENTKNKNTRAFILNIMM